MHSIFDAIHITLENVCHHDLPAPQRIMEYSSQRVWSIRHYKCGMRIGTFAGVPVHLGYNGLICFEFFHLVFVGLFLFSVFLHYFGNWNGLVCKIDLRKRFYGRVLIFINEFILNWIHWTRECMKIQPLDIPLTSQR